jgi:hypothetical protein
MSIEQATKEFEAWALMTTLPLSLNQHGVVLEDGNKYKQFGNLLGLIRGITQNTQKLQYELLRTKNEVERLQNREKKLSEYLIANSYVHESDLIDEDC